MIHAVLRPQIISAFILAVTSSRLLAPDVVYSTEQLARGQCVA